MTELEKLTLAAVASGVVGYVSGVVGYVSGVAQMWWRHRREDRLPREDDMKSFGQAFLSLRDTDKDLDYSAERQLGLEITRGNR